METENKSHQTLNCVNDFSQCLEYILRFKEMPMVWVVRGEKRIVFKGKIKLDVPSHRIFEFVNESKEVSLQANDMVYFKFKFRDLLFRAKIIGIKNGRILMSYPREYRIEENRDTKRKVTTESQYNVVIDKKDDEIIGKTSFSLKLLDMSERGLGLHVSVTKKDCFRKGDVLLLKSIGKVNFDKPLSCTICHVTPLYESVLTVKDYKMGLSMDEPFEESVVKFLLPSF